MHLCSCQCSVVMVDRVLTHSLSNAWRGEVGILPPKCRAGMEDSVLSTVSRAHCREAVRHNFYLIITDLEGGQKSYVLQDISFPSLCLGRLCFLRAFLKKVCYHWHLQFMDFLSTQPGIYWKQKQTNKTFRIHF